MAVLVLVDHAAHRVRIFAGEGAVHHHLRHRDLAAHGFAAGFEIDGFGEAFLRLGARLLVEQAEPLGRRLGALVVGIDFALRRDALAALAGPAPVRRRRPAARPSPSCRDREPRPASRSVALRRAASAPCFRRDAERRAPKNRLAVLTEKPSRDGAGAQRLPVHRGAPSRSSSGWASSDIDTSYCASGGALSASCKFGIERRALRGRRGLGGLCALHRRVGGRRDLRSPARARRAPAVSRRAARRRGDRPSACDRPWGNRRPDSAAAAATSGLRVTEPVMSMP